MRLNGDWKIVSKTTNYFTVHRIALLSVMTALVTVGRLVFALPFLPNIQPMTALLIIITLNIGVLDGLIVSVLSMLLTNLFLGMGPWTGMQIVSFSMIILLTAFLKPFYRFGTIRNRIIYSLWALLTGFIYGWVISYLNFNLYGMSNFLVYYLNGLPFDGLHAVGNLGFFFILEPTLVPIIRQKFYDVLN